MPNQFKYAVPNAPLEQRYRQGTWERDNCSRDKIAAFEFPFNRLNGVFKHNNFNAVKQE
jgi:hypothetical protein